MGNPIRPNAAAADIYTDVRSSYMNAAARKGVALTLAEQSILPIIKVADGIEAQLTAVRKDAQSVLAALDAANAHADDVFQKASDDTWNAVGRPATDPYLSVLLPGGSSFYHGFRTRSTGKSATDKAAPLRTP